MPINSPTGILDVTNATLRAGKLESTGDITCSSNLVVSGGFDLSAINSNADTVVDFTATRQLRKYPREILTSSSQNGYVCSASSVYTGYDAHLAFNNTITDASGHTVTAWTSTGTSPSNSYDGTDNAYNSSGTSSLGGISGEWLKLKLPSATAPVYTRIYPRTWPVAGNQQSPEDFTFLASKDDSTWTVLGNVTGWVNNGTWGQWDIESATEYTYFAVVFTRTVANSIVGLAEWEIHGYESTKGDGQDVRLRAHANGPNTDFLEVHFDANVSNSYPGSGTTLTDLSGEARHATLNNGVGFDSAYGALTFDGSNQNVNTQALGISGDFVHTASLWVKPAVNQSAISATDWSAFFYIGQETYADVQGIALSYRKDELRYWFGGNDVDVTTDFKANEWVHLAVVYRGGGGTTANRDVYVNGVKQRYLRTDGSSYGNALNVQSTAFLRLGGANGTNAAPEQDFNGSIANFRLFKRPLIEAEIHQLYDWEKVRFARVALGDVVAFRDGSLGVGVAEPSRDDRLVVDGRVKADSAKVGTLVDRNDVVVYEQTGPHDRPLTKYPEIAMTANSSGGYVASASSQYAGGLYDIWKAHDGERTSAVSPSYYYSASHEIYSSTNGAYAPGSNPSYSTTSSDTAYAGEYVQMQFPTPIKLSYVRIVTASSSTYYKNAPKQGVICGSNDGTTWTTISAYSGIECTYAGASADIQVSSDVAYTYIRLVVTHIHGAPGSGWLIMEEIDYYGYEEGDVSTDSTWTSVLNKPGTQQLEVYWDGADSNSYPGAGTEVFDLSGNGLTGAMTGVEFDSVYNSFYFDTTNDDRITTTTSASGAYVHSVSMWVKFGELGSSQHFIAHLGTKGSTLTFAGMYYSDNHGIRVVIGNEYRTTYHPPIGEWIHVTYTYAGGTPDSTAGDVIVKFYVNGERVYFAGYYERATGALALPSSSVFQVTGSSDSSGAAHNHYESWVGNARLFSKALSAEQVKELYAYDAVRFGHRVSNSVSVHKGNLGVGVTLPTSRFEVAGADGLFEYPPRSMLDHEIHMEGHGVFRASASTEINMWAAAWEAFGHDAERSGGGSVESVWACSGSRYNTSTGAYTGSVTTAGIVGEWIQLETPHKVKVSSFSLNSYADAASNRQPRDFILLGSNDGSAWEQMKSVTDQTTGYTIASPYDASPGGPLHTVNSTKYYTHFRIVIINVQASNDGLAAVGRVRFFGVPAPSSLDDGHLTLGKALTTPRVSGHAAGVETPRAESLVVHYDTTVDSVASGSTVVDTSGNGINGTLTNGATYSSSDRALTFDGTNDYVVGTLNNPAGDWVHSFSFWMKLNVDQSTIGVGRMDPVQMGSTASTSKYSAIDVHGTTINWYFYLNDVSFPISGIKAGEWNHLTFAYQGGGTNSYRHAYLNGTEVTMTTSLSGGSALNIDANASVALGSDFVRPGAYLNGSISNFKVWNVALTADEVAAEFALGRTGKAMNVTDTAVCLGGTAPRAQLDVRGAVEVSGGIRGTDTTALTLHGCPMVTLSLGPSTSSTLTQFDTGAHKGIWLATLHRTDDRHGNTGLTTSAIIHKTSGISITTLHNSGYIAITNDGNSIKIGSGSAVSKSNLPGTYDFELRMVRLMY